MWAAWPTVPSIAAIWAWVVSIMISQSQQIHDAPSRGPGQGVERGQRGLAVGDRVTAQLDLDEDLDHAAQQDQPEQAEPRLRPQARRVDQLAGADDRRRQDQPRADLPDRLCRTCAAAPGWRRRGARRGRSRRRCQPRRWMSWCGGASIGGGRGSGPRSRLVRGGRLRSAAAESQGRREWVRYAAQLFGFGGLAASSFPERGDPTLRAGDPAGESSAEGQAPEAVRPVSAELASAVRAARPLRPGTGTTRLPRAALTRTSSKPCRTTPGHGRAGPSSRRSSPGSTSRRRRRRFEAPSSGRKRPRRPASSRHDTGPHPACSSRYPRSGSSPPPSRRTQPLPSDCGKAPRGRSPATTPGCSAREKTRRPPSSGGRPGAISENSLLIRFEGSLVLMLVPGIEPCTDELLGLPVLARAARDPGRRGAQRGVRRRVTTKHEFSQIGRPGQNLEERGPGRGPHHHRQERDRREPGHAAQAFPPPPTHC